MKSPHFVWGWLVLLALALLVAPAAVSAQTDELTETYTFESGAAFRYPGNWTLEEEEEVISVSSQETRVFVTDYTHFEELGFERDTDLAKLMQVYFETFYEGRQVTFNPDAILTQDEAGRESVRYSYIDDSGSGAFLTFLRFSDGSFGMIHAVAVEGRLAERVLVLDIIASFDTDGGAETAEGGTGVGLDLSGVDIFCTISTTQSDTARVRVGPGTNRTSIAFLPANQEFNVLGRAEASDGSLWWKVNKDDVAPQSAASETWVAADDVQETGNCEGVADVAAPPIIPIIAAPPPTTGGGQGSDGGGQTAESIVPLGGTWTMSFSDAYASCIGTGTVTVPVHIPPERYSLSVAGGGASITFGGEFLTRVAPSYYQGIYDLPVIGTNPISTNISLLVVSPNEMNGTIVFTQSIDDTACSMTIPVSVRRG